MVECVWKLFQSYANKIGTASVASVCADTILNSYHNGVLKMLLIDS
jgi:hypothetical protein